MRGGLYDETSIDIDISDEAFIDIDIEIYKCPTWSKARCCRDRAAHNTDPPPEVPQA